MVPGHARNHEPIRNACEDVSVEQLDAIFRPLVAEDSPGTAVIVLKNGEVEFKRGYGVANLETKTRIATDTDFRLASFTKQFTATCIMLLVHDGKLSYDDTLTKIFPGLPGVWKRDYRPHAADAHFRAEGLRRPICGTVSWRG